MRVDLNGLAFETPKVTFHLWSPWRSSRLEHKLFEAVRHIPRTQFEEAPDEWRLHLEDPRTWKAALQAVSRVLKGWQEDADPATERRSWRWLIEADVDPDGYDHAGDPASLWLLIRVSLERGGPGEPEKPEDIDLEGFGVRVWGNDAG